MMAAMLMMRAVLLTMRTVVMAMMMQAMIMMTVVVRLMLPTMFVTKLAMQQTLRMLVDGDRHDDDGGDTIKPAGDNEDDANDDDKIMLTRLI